MIPSPTAGTESTAMTPSCPCTMSSSVALLLAASLPARQEGDATLLHSPNFKKSHLTSLAHDCITSLSQGPALKPGPGPCQPWFFALGPGRTRRRTQSSHHVSRLARRSIRASRRSGVTIAFVDNSQRKIPDRGTPTDGSSCGLTVLTARKAPWRMSFLMFMMITSLNEAPKNRQLSVCVAPMTLRLGILFWRCPT